MYFQQIEKPLLAKKQKDISYSDDNFSYKNDPNYQNIIRPYYSSNNNYIDFNFADITIFGKDRSLVPKPMFESEDGCIKCENKDNFNKSINNVDEFKIGRADDFYELEANRNANEIIQLQKHGNKKTIDKKEKEGEFLDTTLMVQRQIFDGTEINETSPVIRDVISSAGQPLDPTMRRFMQSHFGHDFTKVRIHNDSKASKSAQLLNARAYTVGENIVLGEGQYTNTQAGQRLIAHELTHVVQQSRLESNKLIQRELVYASGYPRPYKTDENEIRNAEANDWSPASIDLKTSVNNSGGGTGLDTFKGLLDHIAGKQQGSISELGLLGHSSRQYFGLGGTVAGRDVVFAKSGEISDETIRANMQTIASRSLHNRFADNARIILYGCKAGVGMDLINSISQAFKVCVDAFTNEIDFCFQWKPITGKNRRIISRGRISYNPPDPSDPFSLRPKKACDQYLVNLRGLAPDQQSCKGVVSNKSQKNKEE